jgi:hypothetical protein
MAAGVLNAVITSTFNSASSVANWVSRSNFPSAHRNSKATVRRRSWLQDTQAPHLPRWLLRARRKRPCRRTSNTGDELAPLHSITSSASRWSCPKAGTSPIRTRLQQGFATGGMGFMGQVARQQS